MFKNIFDFNQNKNFREPVAGKLLLKMQLYQKCKEKGDPYHYNSTNSHFCKNSKNSM